MVQIALGTAAGILLACVLMSWWANRRIYAAEQRALRFLSRDVRRRFWRTFVRDYAIGALTVAAVVQTVISLTK